MGKDDIINMLGAHKGDIAAYGVKSLSIFGSVARGEERPESDVDFLVEFSKPLGLFEFIRFKSYLEALIGRRVDLVTIDALKAQMRERILKESVHAA